MPQALTLSVGTANITVPIKLTATQTRVVIRRYAIQQGIAVEGRTDAQIAEDVLRSLLKYVRDKSLDRQRQEEVATLLAQLESTLQSDNDLYDEPPAPAPP